MATAKKAAEREPVGSAGILNHWNCSVCPFWSDDPDAVDEHIEVGEHLPEPERHAASDKSSTRHASPTRAELDAARKAAAEDES